MLPPVTEQTPDSPSANLSPTYQLADMLVREQGGIRAFILSRRADGVAWRRIARDLYMATDTRIDVAHETLRIWVARDAGDPSDQRPDPTDVDDQPEPNGDTEPEARAS